MIRFVSPPPAQPRNPFWTDLSLPMAARRLTPRWLEASAWKSIFGPTPQVGCRVPRGVLVRPSPESTNRWLYEANVFRSLKLPGYLVTICLGLMRQMPLLDA